MTMGSTGQLRALPGFGLVDLADPALPERLAGKVDEQLMLFAAQMRQGLLAASVSTDRCRADVQRAWPGNNYPDWASFDKAALFYLLRHNRDRHDPRIRELENRRRVA